MEISDDLLCLFSATVEQQEESYVLEIPEQEVQHGDLSRHEVYKVGLIATSASGAEAPQEPAKRERPGESAPSPPVAEGDLRNIEIEGVGDQGDGVGKIAGGYVVIVPETEPGDTVTAEMETVRENFAIAEVVQGRIGDGFKTT